VADIMPTLLEIAGASYPKTREGRELPALMGKVLGSGAGRPAESSRTERDSVGWEVFATARCGRRLESSGGVQAARQGRMGALQPRNRTG